MKPGRKAYLLKTGQTTVYHAGDDGSYQKGLAKAYTVLSTAGYSGTTAVYNPGYAAATIAFVTATHKITDSASGLAVFLTGDHIKIPGSALNTGVYTVATGGVAAEIVVTEDLVDESAGAYMTICKRELKSNNTVYDRRTKLQWSRYVSSAVGPASDGKLVWYDAAKCYTLHPAAADLRMIASPATLRIVGGAGEVARYSVGMCVVCAGFANAVNNIPGYPVTAVTVNGADLDISLNGFGATLIAEAAGGSRSIKVECSSIFSYCAAANTAALAGFADWRVATAMELDLIQCWQPTIGVPDATAFPGFPPTGVLWCANSYNLANAIYMTVGNWQHMTYSQPSTSLSFVMLVRGGTT